MQASETAVIADDIRYLDHFQLASRGWTRSLVARFLKRPDSWGTVNHWANFRGKALYDTERVIAAETSTVFETAFARSLHRRTLGEDTIIAFREARRAHDTQYRAWLASLTPEDIRVLVMAQEAAAVFEDMRARGYRSPHK